VSPLDSDFNIIKKDQLKPVIIATSSSPEYTFHKTNQPSIELIEGIGVKGDAHSGSTVKHRSRVRKDPSQPNLRQVHLIHKELFDELLAKGYAVQPGELGENLTTEGLDILNLPKGTLLNFPSGAEIEITGLRNPCFQLDNWQPGLMSAVLDKDEEGNLIRKSGVMAIVLKGGMVSPGDEIQVQFPKPPLLKLEKV
jgi:MOSC domain-containing protein YiiM